MEEVSAKKTKKEGPVRWEKNRRGLGDGKQGRDVFQHLEQPTVSHTTVLWSRVRADGPLHLTMWMEVIDALDWRRCRGVVMWESDCSDQKVNGRQENDNHSSWATSE